MFIVKLILVPLWPFFITSWGMKKFGQEFSIKGYLANLLIFYVLLGAAAYWIMGLFLDKSASSSAAEETAAPSAEVAK